jgi:hypothetical protein
VLAQWQWSTFPTFVAAAAGVVAMGLLVGTELGLILFFVGVFCLALSGAHIVSRQIIANRRRR